MAVCSNSLVLMCDQRPDGEMSTRMHRRELGIREILQTLEDTLVDDGYDDFIVDMAHG
jgi:hypothetical protein